jgi:Stage II sporulation protein E (SpoIIE)
MGWILVTAVVLVALATLAVMLWVLVSREREARRRFRMLAETAAVSDAGGSLEETIDAICEILVPELADFCMIDLIADGEVRRAAVRVSDGAGEGIERGLAERRPSVPERMLEGEGSASLTPRFFERMSDRDLEDLAEGPEDLEFLRSVGIRSAITVALKARGRVTGTLTVGVAWSGRHYRGEDARFAWILSGRIALALDNCGLFADLERAERARTEIAETLQRGLLPPPLPHIPGWSIAAMYRPAGAENEVGGDFYDVFRVADGWMLVIGDVTGRGARAASLTAVARYTLRTAATLTADPVMALRTLNRALFARGDYALCSVVALVLHEGPAQPVTLAIAGHPPPLLIDGEEVSEVSEADPVLGAFADGRWNVSQSVLEPGQQLVVVTDGVFEAQGPGERFGEARLRDELRGCSDPSQLVQALEASLQEFTEGALDDDIAVLALTRAATTDSDRLEALPSLEQSHG